MGKTSESNDPQGSNVLLTPGSSRRKMLWKRLQSSKHAKGLTQDQVSQYLQRFMKQHYQKVRKEGALTFDKVQSYLDYLAKLASGTLSKVSVDQSNVAGYSERIKPVVEDVSTKTAITEEDVERHSEEIRNQAQIHISQITHPAERHDIDDLGNNSEPKDTSSQLQSLDDAETIQPVVSAGKDITKGSEDYIYGDLFSREIVPIGFEEGAPHVSLEAFFSFPLSFKETAPDPGNPFAMHLKYLELAVNESCFENEILEATRAKLKVIREKRYSKYVDIFPENEYDDAKLMIVYSQWRNQTLDRFLIKNEDES